MDFDVDRPAKVCASTGREFAPGEAFFSVLLAEGSEVRRYDYSAEAWQGPPPKCIGWWKSQAPPAGTPKLHWAPNDVMLELFNHLDEVSQADMRYVLALLLVRRRVLRLEEETSAEGLRVLVLYHPRSDTTYCVAVAPPTEERAKQIQDELARLLVAKG